MSSQPRITGINTRPPEVRLARARRFE